MLYYKNNKWNISKFKVRLKDGGQETEKFSGVESKAWWNELAQKHSDIEILLFTDIEPSIEQIKRLEEVNSLNIEDGFNSELSMYVKEGIFPEKRNHVLKDLQLTKMFSIMLGVE